jgi:hypothetical protein
MLYISERGLSCFDMVMCVKMCFSDVSKCHKVVYNVSRWFRLFQDG